MALVQQYYFFKYRRYFNFRSYKQILFILPQQLSGYFILLLCYYYTIMYNTKQCFWCNYSLPCKWYTKHYQEARLLFVEVPIPERLLPTETGGNGSYTYDWWQEWFFYRNKLLIHLTPVFCILISAIYCNVTSCGTSQSTTTL